MGVPDRLTVMKINGQWLIQEWQEPGLICANCAFLHSSNPDRTKYPDLACGDEATTSLFTEQNPTDDISFCTKKIWKRATEEEALVYQVVNRMEI